MKLLKISLFAAILLLIYPVKTESQQESQEIQPPLSSPGDSEMLGSIRRDAERGDVSAQTDLGFMYFLGSGVPLDYKEAEKWFRKAAEQGMAIARFNLGMMYLQGKGVPQDYEEAEEWLRMAAEQQIDAARFNLGMMYLQGKGVPQDYEEAAKWLRRAAEQYMAIAQFNLGMMYLQGKGVPQDYEEAEIWFRRAAEQDYTSAQCMLGVLYAEGWGVTTDYIQAYKWLSLSIAGVTENQSPFLQKATDLRNKIAGQMTRQQMEEAQNLVSKLKPAHTSIPKKIGSDILKSRLIKQVKPAYPEAARKSHIQGVVILIVTVDENGNIEDVRILRGHPLLDYAAIEAVMQWKYSPMLIEGEPVKVIATVTVLFAMEP